MELIRQGVGSAAPALIVLPSFSCFFNAHPAILPQFFSPADWSANEIMFFIIRAALYIF
jgi:hypothetical protein